MLFIGICGASGSGKSTLAHSLMAKLGEEKCLLLQQDAYYKDHPLLTLQERALINYDEPGVFDHEELRWDVERLLNGSPITRKGYDYSLHRRRDSQELLHPREVLILEGIHCFYDQQLCAHMYLKLYMNVEPDICLLRRIARDIKERGREIDGISSQYLTTVKPMYDAYIRNYIHQADVIVAGGGMNARIVDILAAYVLVEMGKP